MTDQLRLLPPFEPKHMKDITITIAAEDILHLFAAENPDNADVHGQLATNVMAYAVTMTEAVEALRAAGAHDSAQTLARMTTANTRAGQALTSAVATTIKAEMLAQLEAMRAQVFKGPPS